MRGIQPSQAAILSPALVHPLLTACPRTQPIVIDMPSNPSVLSGTWKGQVSSAISTREEVLDAEGQRLYLLHSEQFHDFGPQGPSRGAQSIVILEAASGAEVRRILGDGAAELRLRPGAAGVEAGVLDPGKLREPWDDPGRT